MPIGMSDDINSKGKLKKEKKKSSQHMEKNICVL
jgi:hypothetical protein